MIPLSLRALRSVIHLGMMTLLIIVTSTSSLPAEPRTGEEAYLEHVGLRWDECDSVVLVCTFSKKWVPPTKEFPKGQFVFQGRIVDSLKGDARIDQKIEFTYYIEDSPRFLKDPFEVNVDGKLRYLFFYKEDTTVEKDLIKISGDGHWGFEYDWEPVRLKLQKIHKG